MYSKYILSNGKEVYIYLWDDILKGYNYRQTTTAHFKNKYGKKEKEFEINIKKDDENNLYTEIKGEKIILKDFEYYKIDDLIYEIESNSNNLTDDDFVATFIKDYDNIALLSALPKREYSIPDMAISIFSCEDDEAEKILCILSDKDYDKNKWSYKVTIEPESDKDKKIYGNQILYLSDLVWAIKRGVIELVNKTEYKNFENGISKTLK